MAIERVGSAGGTTTLTFPTHKIGDLLIIFAFRDGSTTNPTIPSGWTLITNTTDGTSCSISMAYRIATVTNTSSGTWTNASRIIGVIYRGQAAIDNPLGTFQPSAGTAASVNYAADALANSNVIGSSWFAAFAGHRSIDTNLGNPPANMSMVLNEVDATCEMAIHDTNAPAIANWPSTNVAVGGTASGWITVVIEIKAEGNKLNNFAFPKSASAGIISITEKIK